MTVLKVGALQLALNKSNNLDYVINSIENFCRDNKSLELVILSELAVGGPGAKNTDYRLDKYISAFSDLAKKLDIWLITGTFYEQDGDSVFNTAPVFNSNGELVTKARKLYPWLPYEINVDSGNDICIFDMPGKGIIGVHICYDLWFPETSRALAIAGAELIINPTLTPTKDREIETLMVRTTAAQQQAYYIDVNSCGDQGCGLSIAADPEGNILHKSSDQEDLFTIDVDFDVSHNSRVKGYMNLGQNLKSYRDNSFDELCSLSKNDDYLNNLGELKDFNKEK